MKKVASDIQRKGKEALVIKGDISNGEDVKRLVERALTRFSGIDILVNNVGISYANVALHNICHTINWSSPP